MADPRGASVGESIVVTMSYVVTGTDDDSVVCEV